MLGAGLTILGEDYYVLFVHPDAERDIREIAARDKWAHASRQARILGHRHLPPSEVLARFSSVGLLAGELGTWGSYRACGAL